MRDTMNQLICYKTLPEWDFNALPKGFREKHNTKVGTWAKMQILSGSLTYYALNEQGEVLSSQVFDSHSEIPFVEPQAWHKVEPLTQDLRCQLSFYCQPQDYYVKKYLMSAVHSSVVEVVQHIHSGTALDVGCGGGRNALFLQQQGFSVNAFDKNPNSIGNLQNIIAQESLPNIQAYIDDALSFKWQDKYDLIISTVVFMFLPEEGIAELIKNMQQHTQSGGYNLIVCALDSEDYPLAEQNVPFAFGFKPNELKNHYNGWYIKQYNEDIGHLHKVDANGNPIALRFATLIAQKP